MTEPLLVFTLEDRRLALKASSVIRAERAAEITPLPDAPAGVRGLVNIAGTIVPVYDLRVKFQMPPRDLRASDFFILAAAGSRTVAVIADDLIGLVECAVTSTESIAPEVSLVDGVVKLDSDLVLIHDLGRFLSDGQEELLKTALHR